MYNETIIDCPSRTSYIILFAVFLSIRLIIGSAFIYFYWYKKSDLKNDVHKFNYSISETQIN